MKVRVDRNVLGVDFHDGYKADSSRSGIVDLDDAHYEEIRHSGQKRDGFVVVGTVFNETSGKHCPRDWFSAFHYQTVCPRCGTTLVQD